MQYILPAVSGTVTRSRENTKPSERTTSSLKFIKRTRSCNVPILSLTSVNACSQPTTSTAILGEHTVQMHLAMCYQNYIYEILLCLPSSSSMVTSALALIFCGGSKLGPRALFLDLSWNASVPSGMISSII